jgi:hypothetical protein
MTPTGNILVAFISAVHHNIHHGFEGRGYHRA